MLKQKNFLILAVIVGIAGVVIGTITIFSSISNLIQP
jgi:hypothetical protein